MEHFPKSHRLENVRSVIRVPVLQEAMHLEEAAHQMVKLNICNPAPSGFEGSDGIAMNIIRKLTTSPGNCACKCMYSARNAIVKY